MASSAAATEVVMRGETTCRVTGTWCPWNTDSDTDVSTSTSLSGTRRSFAASTSSDARQLFTGRRVVGRKIGKHGPEGSDVDGIGECDAAACGGFDDSPVLRQFIYKFTETRVRSELAERRRTPRSALLASHAARRDAGRLKVPSYRRMSQSSVGRTLGSGRIEKILKSIIIRTISEKLCTSSADEVMPQTSWLGDAGELSNRVEEPATRLRLADMDTHACDVLDSRSSSSDDGNVVALADDMDSRRGLSLSGRVERRKSRPKRGQYRKYNRQLLLDAVRAVQKGDMSVHRAGSYYGVPHSTLEYKVKERHLLRQRKTESTAPAPVPAPVAVSGSARTRRRSLAADDRQRSSRPSTDAAPETPEHDQTSATQTYFARLQRAAANSQWPYSLPDSVLPWSNLFRSDSPASSAKIPRPPPPLVPFDLFNRSLPVGFGWPPPPPPPPGMSLLTGMFPLSADDPPTAGDGHRLPLGLGGPPPLPFSMSASDLLKCFQQKAVASGGGSDVREMVDDRFMSLFPLLGGGPYSVSDEDGSPSQVMVG